MNDSRTGENNRGMRRNINVGLMLGWQDIKKSYRRSVFGQVWITIGMSVTIAAIGLVFGTIFGSPMEVFLPYLASGIISWALITGILNDGANTFIAAEGMIKQISINKLVYLLRVVWRSIIISAHNMVIFPVVLLIFAVWPGRAILLWPIGVALAVFSLSGAALILGILSIRYRDVPNIVNAALTVAFYSTPVIWMRENVGDNPLVDAMVNLNPLYHLLSIMRLPLIGQYPSAETWIWALISGLLFWAIALTLFRKYQNRIAYWV
jgi:ABC-type polysaccharide/polyol phosphate export permease